MKILPSPHCRVQIAGDVTGDFQGSPAFDRCVVVANTFMYESASNQYCSVVRSKF